MSRRVPRPDLECQPSENLIMSLYPRPYETKHVGPTDLETKAEALALDYVERNAVAAFVPACDVPAAVLAFKGSEIARQRGDDPEIMSAALNLWRARQPYIGAPPGPAPTPAEVWTFKEWTWCHGQAEAEKALGGVG